MMKSSITPLIAVVCLVCASSSFLFDSKLVVNALEVSQSQNVTKVQARIFHETQSLDLDELDSITITTQPSTSGDNTTAATSNSKNVKRKTKGERSNRRLSNIWSMFLPGSSAQDSDYEDTVEEVEANNGEVASSNQISKQKETTEPGSRSNATSPEEHNERLVAKYNKPVGQEKGLGDSLITSSSSRQATNSSGAEAPMGRHTSSTASSVTTTTSPDDLQPVKLITGTVNKDMPPFEPNMNDIVSNLMSSLASGPSSSVYGGQDTSSTTTGKSVEVEREEDEKANSVRANSSATNSDNSSFERWLNRIQFQSTPSGMIAGSREESSPNNRDMQVSKKITESNKTGDPALQSAVGLVTNKTAEKSRTDTSPPKLLPVFPAKWLQSLRVTNTSSSPSESSSNLRQQQTRQVQRTPSPSKQHQPLQQQQQQQLQQTKRMVNNLRNGSTKSQVDERSSHGPFPARYNQHPFQQQLRQQQTQLIHGIKYPSAQASTISVSTQDGASNTSLSFAMMDAMGNEMSQVVNSSQLMSESTSGAKENGNTEQSAYQSQDEILRQVTSAINFEQQLNNNHRKSAEQKPMESEGDLASSNNNSNQDFADGLSKLFKVGTSINELVDSGSSMRDSSSTTEATPAGRSTSMSPMELLKSSANERGGSSGQFGTDNIDKSLDMLAEKLRQLAQQQQQISNGSQPTWLRPQTSLLDFAGQAGNNAAGSSSNQTGRLQTANPSMQPAHLAANLEKIRELLNKHERTKNELRNSQESMAQLVKQLMQTESGAKLLSEDARLREFSGNQIASLLGGDKNSGDPQISDDFRQAQEGPAGVSNVGWTPVKPQAAGAMTGQANAPASPANLMKSKAKLPSIRPGVNKLPMDGGVVFQHDPSNEDLHMNNLALMFASSQASEDANELRPNQQIIGLPIAILKENEVGLSPAQIEAAAMSVEQLVGQKRHLAHQDAGVHPPRLDNSAPSGHRLDQMMHHPAVLKNMLPGYSHGLAPRAPPGSPLASGLPQSPTLQQIQQLVSNANKVQPQDDSETMRQNLQNALNTLSLNQMSSLIHDQSQLEQQHQGGLFKSSTTNSANSAKQTVNLLNHQDAAGFSDSDEQLSGVAGDMDGHKAHSTSGGERQQHSPNEHHNQGDARLMKQAQHLQRNQVNPPPRQPAVSFPQQQQQPQQQQAPPAYPMRYAEIQYMAPHMAPHRLPPITTTTITGGGPPVKVREMNLYKPFGFQSHHAIAYQANPVLASVFSGLNQPPRPSLLRHMTPLRASFGPIFQPPPIQDNFRHQPYGNAFNQYPVPPGQLAPFAMHPAGPYQRIDNMKRHAPPKPLEENWRSKLGNSYSASKLRVKHLDPATIEPENIMEDLDGRHQLEEIKFIPVDGYNNAQLDHDDLRLVQRHIMMTNQSRKSQPRLNVRAPSVMSSGHRSNRGRFSDIESIAQQMEKSNTLASTEAPCIKPKQESSPMGMEPLMGNLAAQISNSASSTATTPTSNERSTTQRPSRELASKTTMRARALPANGTISTIEVPAAEINSTMLAGSP